MGKGNAETNNGAHESAEGRSVTQDRTPNVGEADKIAADRTREAEEAARRMIERNQLDRSIQDYRKEYGGKLPASVEGPRKYAGGYYENGDNAIFGAGVDQVIGEDSDYEVKADRRFTYEGTPGKPTPDVDPQFMIDLVEEGEVDSDASLARSVEANRAERNKKSNPYPKGSDQKINYTYSSVAPNDLEGEQAAASAEVREARSIDIDPSSLEGLSGPAVDLYEAMDDFAMPEVEIDFDDFNQKVRRVNGQELSTVVKRANSKVLEAISKNEKVNDRLRTPVMIQVLQNIIEDMNNGVIIYTERLPKVNQETAAALVNSLSFNELEMLSKLPAVNFIVTEADKRAAKLNSDYTLKYPSLSPETQNNS